MAAGIAQGAIEDFTDLAGTKQPVTASSSSTTAPTPRLAVAEATALRAAGWAWVREVAEELWALASVGERIPREVHARARLAASSSVHSSVRAVELVSRRRFDRRLRRLAAARAPLPRDVHAVPQHFTVAPYQMATAGRVLLGLPADDPAF